MAEPLIHQLDDYAIKAIKAGVVVAVAALATFVLQRVTRWLTRHARRMIVDRGGEVAEFEKQSNTVAIITQRLLIGVIWVLALAEVLDLFGMDVRPLLATAGVAGIAIGFAAQNILKDLIGGFFLLAEGQIRVNDAVTINGLSGSVEELSLRNTVLRGENGSVHVISNGSITQLSNHTRAFSFYVFELSLDARQAPESMLDLLRQVTEELRADEEYRPLILAPLEVFGLDRFTEQGVSVKARIKTLAGQQWKVGREANRRLKERADAAGIRFATAQRVVNLYEEEDSPRPRG